jgi:LacI family transcriptional regulator
MKRGMTMVFLDRRPVGVQADTVLIENVGGSAAGAGFLFDRGHRRIAVVGQDLRIFSMEQRLAGVRQAAEKAGVELDESLIRFGPLTPDQAAVAAGELLDLADPPTAFFCCTNRITLGVMDELNNRGSPLDVVGFDDLERRHIVPMPVGVITYDLEELGRRTAELLFRRIGGDREGFEEVVVPTNLISP